MKELSSFVSLAFVIFSCSPIYYAPNAAQVPLFTQRKQLAAAASGTDGGIQFDGGPSISDHIPQPSLVFFTNDCTHLDNRKAIVCALVGEEHQQGQRPSQFIRKTGLRCENECV